MAEPEVLIDQPANTTATTPIPVKVEKRDGRIVDFDPINISTAIKAAYGDINKEVGPQEDALIRGLADKVESEIKGRYTEPAKIDDIQNLVEHALVDAHLYDVAHAYVDYRLSKDIDRSKMTDVNEAVRRFIDRDPELVHENANKDSNVYSTQRDLLAGAVSKATAFRLLPKAVANAHMKVDIHFHDADYSPFTAQSNCFSPSTAFVTCDGTREFRDFKNGDRIFVPTPFNGIREATVVNHGAQPVQEITFVDGDKTDSTRLVVATPDHRWPIQDGSIGHITDNLQEGDVLAEYNGHEWHVKSIRPMTEPMEVWCLNVEDVHEFILDGGIPTENCSLPNFWDMLANGFTLGNAPMASPKSIAIAATQITQIMKDVASSQYGGQTANRADEHLAQYARKDYEKFLEEARETIPDGMPVEFARRQVENAKKNEPAKLHFGSREPLPMDTPFHTDVDELEQEREILAKIRTRKAIYDAMQTMEYQINSNRVSNGQTPFVTVGFGLGTDWFSREIQRAILLNRIRGLGKEHHTAIFPKLVFTVKHGVNADPGDPNYDLKQLALESATKRMYPDVVFYENIVKITGSFKAPMGAVDGAEIVTWSDGDRQYTESFKAMWSHMVQRYGVERQQTGNPEDFVVELDDKPILIKDSYSGTPEFVKVRRIIKNASRQWLRITFEDGQTIDCTPDHPFPVENYPNNEGRARVEALHLKPGYEIPRADGKTGTTVIKSVTSIELDEPSYDVTTASDHFDCSGIVSHNCRSFLQGWENPETGKDEEDGRMNLGVVTVNVPRIAIESHGDKARFWKLFNERMEVAHQALQFRIMRCKEATPVNAPTLFRFGAFGRLGANDNVDQLFKNERATVSLGYIGLAETTAVFYGKNWIRDHGWDPEGKEFALSIVKHMNELCKQWSKSEGYHYSVYSTPAESLTDRFNRMDREKFGRIEGVTDHDFYTNSFHYPVWLQPTPMEKLNYEKDFPYYASGGFINYCEYPCLQDNPKALEAVWDYAYNIGIGYLGTNTPIDHCFVCGFQGDFEPTEEGFKCPECGNSDPDKCNVTKRTCGYLGSPVQRPMVHGRHEEIAHRVKHMSGETGRVTLNDGTTREWFESAK